MDKQIIYRIYCGRNISNGDTVFGAKSVSDLMLQEFISKHVCPKFMGSTLYELAGYWNDIREPATAIEIIATDSEQAAAKIRIIAKRYKAEFKQDAVLVTHQSIECELI